MTVLPTDESSRLLLGKIVDLRHVGRYFPPSTEALQDVSFTIRAGDSVAIVGASGSGKSTLLAILGLLDTASSGSYSLFGTDVSAIDDAERTRQRRLHLGFVFQAFHLIPHLTAVENVEYAATIAGMSRRDALARAKSSLEDVGLTDRFDSFPSTLSGGEQQRVAIARAIAHQPRLLLCDEPTGNLDSKNTQLILDLLFRTQGETTALVIVTHDAQVSSRCRRQLHISDGRLSEIL